MTELVFLQNDQPVTTSLKVAKVFGKRHDLVIRDIRNLIQQGEGLRNFEDTPMFQESTYIHEQNNQEYPMYLMNQDGFTLLVMGFTGREALQCKLDYIKAFNVMREKLFEIMLERRNEEWREIRRTGKRGNRAMTDAIQQVLIPLAREQGATADDKFFYINYQKAVNKAAGIKPKSRDDLSIEQLYEVEKIQSMATCSIKGLAAKKADYHKIYKDTNKTLENYSQISLINQRFLS